MFLYYVAIDNIDSIKPIDQDESFQKLSLMDQMDT